MTLPCNSFETIEVTESDDDIALVTLNRPGRGDTAEAQAASAAKRPPVWKGL